MFKAVKTSVKSRIITVTSLCMIVLLMGIFFASQSYSTAIDAVKINKSEDKWEVKLNKTSYQTTEGSINPYHTNILSNVVISDVTLTNPGEYYEYSIELENNGTLEATLNKISIEGLNNYVTANILVNGETFNEDLDLESETKLTVTVRVTYNETTIVVPQYLKLVTTFECEQK